jgi:hypothetical protein
MSSFKFIDLPTSAERLGTTRNQMLQWVTEGRIKPFSGSGQASVFRASDVDRLAAELGLSASPSQTPTQEPAASPEAEADTPSTTRRRRRDPVKLVGTRLSMDSRWAEISEADIAAWLDATEPVQFDRVRKVSTLAITSLQRLLAMMDEHERHLRKGKG